MSQENVALLHAAFDAWYRQDYDAVLAIWDEETEIYPLRAQLEGRAYHGHEGVRRFMGELAEDWDEVRFEVDEIRDAGEQMAGSGRFLARGRGSGVELDEPFGIVAVVRNNRIVFARFLSDPAAALEAVGLSE
jgi:ketosteroid isomerase-like protein